MGGLLGQVTVVGQKNFTRHVVLHLSRDFGRASLMTIQGPHTGVQSLETTGLGWWAQRIGLRVGTHRVAAASGRSGSDTTGDTNGVYTARDLRSKGAIVRPLARDMLSGSE